VKQRIITAAVAGFLALGASAAHADVYPITSTSVTASSASLPSGDSQTLTASGFCTGTTVIFTVNGTYVGQGTADVNGVASTTFNAASGGNVAATSSGNVAGCNGVATTTFSVVAAGGPDPTPSSTAPATSIPVVGGGSGSSGLPTTGSDTSSSVQVAGVLVLAGAGLVGVSMHRRRRTAAAA